MKTTYQFVFIPNDEDAALSEDEALEFSQKLETEFGYTAVIEKNVLNDKQYVVYLVVEFEDIAKIVRFMQNKKFGESVAERWWLNTVQSFNPWCIVTGINTADQPVATWIHELPRPQENLQK